MILANSVTGYFTDALNGLAVAGALMILAIYFVIAAIVLAGRHIKRDYDAQGGLPTLAKKAAARGVGEIIKRAIKSCLP